jgi:hypothetical protein
MALGYGITPECKRTKAPRLSPSDCVTFSYQNGIEIKPVEPRARRCEAVQRSVQG